MFFPFQARPPGRVEAGRGHGGLREAEAAAAATVVVETAAPKDGGHRRQKPKTQQNAKTRRCDAIKVRTENI